MTWLDLILEIPKGWRRAGDREICYEDLVGIQGRGEGGLASGGNSRDGEKRHSLQRRSGRRAGMGVGSVSTPTVPIWVTESVLMSFIHKYRKRSILGGTRRFQLGNCFLQGVCDVDSTYGLSGLAQLC